MKYARIINDTAVDVVDAEPSTVFHESIVNQFVEVPDHIETGWRLDDGEWVAPPTVEPPSNDEAPAADQSKKITRVSPIDFMVLFSSPERVALKKLRSTDEIIDDFFEILNDPRLNFVHLDRESNRQGVHYCFQKLVENDIVSAEVAPIRIDQVLNVEFI